MVCRRYGALLRQAFVLAIACVSAIVIASAPATAQGLLGKLLPGFRLPPASASARSQGPSDFLHSLFGGRADDHRPRERVHSAGGPRVAYCVRLCDGRYYPIQPHRNYSAAEQCRSSCPAANTRTFYGSGIDHAVARDGKRYASLANAYLYRKRIVAGCTCNGRTNYSLDHIPVRDDPTLRRGDIVVTDSGPIVYSGRNPHRTGAFASIGQAHISAGMRNRLAQMKIRPKHPSTISTTGAAPGVNLSAR